MSAYSLTACRSAGLILLLVAVASFVAIDAKDVKRRDANAKEADVVEDKTHGQEGVTARPLANKINCSLPANINSTNCTNSKTVSSEDEFNKIGTGIFDQMRENKDMLLRTLYVTLGVTGIVVFYFVVRAVRLRRKRTKSRKYGIITQHGDHGDMEMEPLGDGDDDDDDYTVFEMNGRKK